MANFECKVYKVKSVEKHPNADKLDIVYLDGLDYTCIANKLENGESRYKPGDLVVYIPENALLPQWMLVKLGLWSEERQQGMLAGKNGNRCKAIRLRGIYSEGILYPIKMNVPFVDMDTNVRHFEDMLEYYTDEGKRLAWVPVHEGENVADLLGVTKYEPPIPQHMSGEVFGAGDIFYHYDIESIHKYPNVLQEGEEVKITEKLHGCVDYDTIIDTVEYGKIKIGKLFDDDLQATVKCYNHITKTVEYLPITGKKIQDNINNWYEITLANGIKLHLTGNHPVWCENIQAYRKVEDLDGTEVLLVDF